MSPRSALYDCRPPVSRCPSQCVYSMRMARVNVYLPDEIADAARAADLNISSLTQDAIRRELQMRGLAEWVEGVLALGRPRVEHVAIQKAIDAARDEFGADGG